MANVGIILLFSVAGILLLGLIVLIVWSIVERVNHNNNSNGGNTGTNTQESCTETTNVDTLIQIPNTGADCIQDGVTGLYYCITNLGTGTYDYVVAPWQTPPFTVCVGFCTGFTGGTCYGPNRNGQSAQDNYNNCMSQLTSTECVPPKPIAIKGTILYYAYVPTCSICSR